MLDENIELFDNKELDQLAWLFEELAVAVELERIANNE
jgi:hypothetical protein